MVKTTKKVRKPTKKPIKSKKVPRKSGRPTGTYKINDVLAEKIMSVFKIDGTIKEACAFAGIDEKTHTNWINCGAHFFREIVVNGSDGVAVKKTEKILYKDAVDEARAFSIIVARKTIYKDIQNGNAKQAMKLLEKRDDRYKQKIEISEGDEINEEDLTD